jgi:hypothetical protein
MGSCRLGDSKLFHQNVMKQSYTMVFLSYQEAVYGFVGEKYQRFYIHFDSISPKDSSYLHYMIWGKTKIKEKVSGFTGELHIKQLLEINEKIVSDNNSIQDIEIQKRYSNTKYKLESDLKIFEDSHLKETGIITGSLISYFYLKDNKPVFYDLDLEYNDAFCNNQFSGEWISYSNNIRKKCCWGAFRIPECGDLDIGAAEFHPNPKYRDYGWNNLITAYETDSEEDWIKERTVWW